MSIDVLQGENPRPKKIPPWWGLDPTPEVVPGYLLEEARQELGATPLCRQRGLAGSAGRLLEGLRDVVPAVEGAERLL